ncbi:Methylated-DNA-protein-cysteine S-methyltransferase related protein [uncultured Stenotrophomonas sp.]|uniref:Methylated-DNA-protein-cysteine S-methyltransferase related protein n=1 Tax=uncultured Stenotrophomonas sp. TaxID=165438 RepID=A0A1Y5Q5L3_9GAMM|nr:Methylated-DNA-protein-cysteine S-methyltransferase related protein [uncultured Stenotrophomonas sp.]
MKRGEGAARGQARAVSSRGKDAVADPADGRAGILGVIRGIPRGQVMGYGEVAAKAGLPGRARLVARLLGDNDDPALPWHRVLRSDGRIALPEGSAGWREQCQRLRAEGVAVENGRVKRARPVRNLDAAIWGPG